MTDLTTKAAAIGDGEEQLRRLSIDGDLGTPPANSRKRTHENDLNQPPAKTPSLLPATDVIRDSHTEIIKFLKSHVVHDIMPASGCSIILDSQLRVSAALRIFLEQRLNAAPIWDSPSQHLIAMLTVTTFIEVLLQCCDDENHVSEDIANQTIKQWLELIGKPKAALVTLGPDASLFDACKNLQDYRFHRLPVVEENGDDQCVLFLVDYLGMLKFLLSQLDPKAAVLTLSVGDLRIGAIDNVITCEMDTTLVVVLRQLYQHSITAVPIVDKQGVVLDLLCRADVLCIARENQFTDLNITVSQVLELRNKQTASATVLNTCLLSDSLLSVFEKLSTHHTHRLIIVDDNRHLLGVLSLADLFRFFLGDLGTV
eukprot:c5094_g1_i1.p1 GENE.c5094_g1_i1~~c5094_g1_i1.p1  ORF type:complete len:380 (-),score=96.46 c5094_g1_i1:79-1188(-)